MNTEQIKLTFSIQNWNRR